VFAGAKNINVGRVSEVKFMKVPVEAQHSHSREKVVVNFLLQAKRVLVDCRGLEIALEAVRVSVEAVRLSIEASRFFRGLERLKEVPENDNWGRENVAEAKKVPVEVVREPVGKTVLKILEHVKTFCFCSKVFILNGKVPLLF
jgi:hypothetical protein